MLLSISELLALGNAAVPIELMAICGNPEPASLISQLLIVLLLLPVLAAVLNKITPLVVVPEATVAPPLILQ